MQVARLFDAGAVAVGDEPDPEPAAGESLVRVEAVGLCGSDLHWFGEGGIGDAHLTRPLVLGHEMSGTVLTGALAGRRVAIDPAITDGTCRHCRAGHPNLCQAVRFAGHAATDGGLRGLMAWPDHLLHPLPERLSAAAGALLEPLGVAIHTLDLGHVRSGDRVAVIGAGPIGLLTIARARQLTDAPILAVEPRPHRRAAALAFGADRAVDPAQALEAGTDLTGGAEFDVTVDAAGGDGAVALAIALARPGARVALAGIPDSDDTTFSASTARRKGLTLLMVRRMGEVYPRAIEASASIDLDALVTHRFGLADTVEAFATAVRRDGLKVLVEP